MNVIRDDWGPLIGDLQEKLSSQGRRRLLFQCIGDIQDIAMLNFGADGMARPYPWRKLKQRYANKFHSGDTTPKLILSGAMLASFKHSVSDTSATLTNTAEYADSHQFGEGFRGLPARPYYPITVTGELSEFALARQREILNAHFGA